MHQRPHLEVLKARISASRSFIQVIAGPRQVGKTTVD
jgi:predicted AAA+ superfamily ATPase